VIDVPAQIVNNKDPETGQNISRANYKVRLRRKTLFYTVNLIIPSMLISLLSMVSFYLPTTAGEKITMSVSILLALVVFLQVVHLSKMFLDSIVIRPHQIHEMRTTLIDVPVAGASASLSISLTRGFGVQTWLNRSKSCFV